jgi:hypothetical protein
MTGQTGCPSVSPPPPPPPPPQTAKIQVQACSGGPLLGLEITNYSSIPTGFAVVIGGTCYEVEDDNWTGAIDSVTTADSIESGGCGSGPCAPPPPPPPPPPTPPQSWFSERIDTLDTGYITIAQGYNPNDEVLVNDGSGICWVIGELSATQGEYNITGPCPPPPPPPPPPPFITSYECVASTCTQRLDGLGFYATLKECLADGCESLE